MTGITPAHAGKSGAPTLATAATGDHPRVCGEKISQTRRNLPWGGSPPRVRGKVHFLKVRLNERGITPACAGKSQLVFERFRIFWDYPRVCGEKMPFSRESCSTSGSPPRMRGKGRHPGSNHPRPGITPAYAGKSLSVPTHGSRPGDHPRVCGEKFHPASDRKLGRVRGTKRSSSLSPAAAPAGLAGSCPASRPSQFPPRITVISPRP